MAVVTSIDPRSILDFWFGDAADDPARAQAREAVWFEAPDELDAEVRQRFGAAIEAAARGELEHWSREARSALALVLLLDQFPRNAWRGTRRAFAHDRQALETARASVASGHLALIERFGRFPHRNEVLGRESTPAERAFLSVRAENFGQGLR